MEDAALAAGIRWVVGTALAIGALFGINKLAELRLKRKYERENRDQNKQDENERIHASNQGKQLELDAQSHTRMLARMESLESKVDALQEKLSTVMADNAGLKAENEFLKKENERLEGEQQKNRERIRELETDVVRLEAKMERMIHWQEIEDKTGIKRPTE